MIHDDFPFVIQSFHNGIIRPEGDGSAGILAISQSLHFFYRLSAIFIFLHPNFSVAVHLGFNIRRQGVDHGDADAVQTAGNFVTIIAEFSTGVQYGHYDF